MKYLNGSNIIDKTIPESALAFNMDKDSILYKCFCKEQLIKNGKILNAVLIRWANMNEIDTLCVELHIGKSTYILNDLVKYDYNNKIFSVIENTELKDKIIIVSASNYVGIICKIDDEKIDVKYKDNIIVKKFFGIDKIHDGDMTLCLLDRKTYIYDDGSLLEREAGWYLNSFYPSRRFEINEDGMFDLTLNSEYFEYNDDESIQLKQGAITKQALHESLQETLKKVEEFQKEGPPYFPINKLVNPSFEINQRNDKTEFTISTASIKTEKFIADRWALKTYKEGDNQWNIERINKNNEGVALQITCNEQKGIYPIFGLEQRYNLAFNDRLILHDLIRGDSDQKYTFGCYVKGLKGKFELKLVYYVVYKNDKKIEQICKNIFHIDENTDGYIHMPIDIDNVIIDKLKKDECILECVSIIPSIKSECKFVIDDVFLISGIWDKMDALPNHLFTIDLSMEMIKCQKYYQRIIDEILLFDLDGSIDCQFIGSVHFKNTMISGPMISMFPRGTNGIYENNLSHIPNLNPIDIGSLEVIQDNNNFVLDPTSERFNVRVNNIKGIKGKYIGIFTWDAECRE